MVKIDIIDYSYIFERIKSQDLKKKKKLLLMIEILGFSLIICKMTQNSLDSNSWTYFVEYILLPDPF